jgi:hypothetical protein
VSTVHLKQGDQNEYVRQVQDRLVELGFAVDWEHQDESHHQNHLANTHEHADQMYGDRTRAAIMAFQAAYGLHANGHVDDPTWTMLFGGHQQEHNIAAADPADRPTAERLIELCLHHVNDTYDLGTDADHHNADVHVFDCAELISWACAQLGIEHIPAYSVSMFDHCSRQGGALSVGDAAHIRGALVYREPADGHPGHVALSLGGGGQTIEAMGAKWGVCVGHVTDQRFTYGAYIPGIEYHH